MWRLIILCIAAACCVINTGCATRLGDSSAVDASGPARGVLVFQNHLLDPRNGGQLAEADSLRAGDIILSASSGITSAGIRLLTLSPVSHAALYLGDRQVAEAVGEGIRIRQLDEMLAEEAVIVVFRHPRLTSAGGEKIREFASNKIGVRYNHIGVLLHAPFSLERRACELPLIPEVVRDFCIRGVALIQLGASDNDRFFCSQFVMEAYRHAGLPITDADPRWISPADILHMREGDVPSVRIHQALLYVGHLKYRYPPDGFDQNASLQ